jgi:hypothetical protein
MVAYKRMPIIIILLVVSALHVNITLLSIPVITHTGRIIYKLTFVDGSSITYHVEPQAISRMTFYLNKGDTLTVHSPAASLDENSMQFLRYSLAVTQTALDHCPLHFNVYKDDAIRSDKYPLFRMSELVASAPRLVNDGSRFIYINNHKFNDQIGRASCRERV